MSKKASTTFDEQRLRDCCREGWDYFEDVLGVNTSNTKEGKLLFKDNGANLLAIAHTDFVCKGQTVDFLSGPYLNTRLVMCPSLDDRLGVYLLLYQAKRFGIKYDILLTEGEEGGRSTACYFKELFPKAAARYNWMFQFDRAGGDVVTYQYDSEIWKNAIRTSTGREVERGQCSDISRMGNVGVSGCNIGIGYRDYHTPMAHVFWCDVNSGLIALADLHRSYGNKRFPYVPSYGYTSPTYSWDSKYSGYHPALRYEETVHQKPSMPPWASMATGQKAKNKCVVCQNHFFDEDFMFSVERCTYCTDSIFRVEA